MMTRRQMMTTIRIGTIAVLAAVALAAGGCAQSPRAVWGDGGSAPLPNSSTLVVRNQTVADIEVFVIAEGDASTRMGMVPDAATVKFAIDPAFLRAGSVRVMATRVGGTEVYRSEPLAVMPGQTITFTIEPDMRLSSATVR
jgi:hypothetical protein